MEKNEINVENLESVTGGNGAPGQNLHLAQPHIEKGYLALRSAPAWSESNEIAQIKSGQRFYVDLNKTATGSGYTFFYANYNGTRGWVNSSYITLLD